MVLAVVGGMPHRPIVHLQSNPPKLLDRVRAAIRLRHFSRKTEEAYVGWVRRFIIFHQKRHPAEMAEAEVTMFLTHLAGERRVSASTQNQALCALLFLYRHVIGRELGVLDGLVWAKRSVHVPVVMTRDEVVAVLQLQGRVMARGGPALWRRSSADRVPGIAGEEHRLRRPADCGVEW